MAFKTSTSSTYLYCLHYVRLVIYTFIVQVFRIVLAALEFLNFWLLIISAKFNDLQS